MTMEQQILTLLQKLSESQSEFSTRSEVQDLFQEVRGLRSMIESDLRLELERLRGELRHLEEKTQSNVDELRAIRSEQREALERGVQAGARKGMETWQLVAGIIALITAVGGGIISLISALR